MKPRLPTTGTDTSAPGFGSPPRDDVLPGSPARREDRACCWPAQPVVRVIMPPAPKRPQSVDLLLCGHHYRVSDQALARVEHPALFRSQHRDHAEATTGPTAGPA
jgi:hypothetical protein